LLFVIPAKAGIHFLPDFTRRLSGGADFTPDFDFSACLQTK
jgi:hypothetical protein